MTKSKRSKSHKLNQQLLPGLPDHLAQICLSQVRNPSLLFSVCQSWRRLIYSPSYPPFLSLYALLSPKNQNPHHNSIHLYSFDPISSSWISLPPLPQNPLLKPFLLNHPSFLSRQLPIQSVTVSNNLILVAGTTDNLLPALSNPLIFNPESNQWLFGPPIENPRRWCVVGSVGGSLYVASGIGTHYNREVAQSAEKLEFLERERGVFRERKWEKLCSLKDSKFSREAVEAVGWRGKLCMVNVKGNSVKEGIIYDVNKDSWEEMPQGIIMGWNGPVTSMDEDVIYAIDESKGILKKYDVDFDIWVDVIESINLIGAVQITAGGGKVCVVSGHRITVIDVVAKPVKMWDLKPPEDFEVVGIHVLPRMNRPESDPIVREG